MMTGKIDIFPNGIEMLLYVNHSKEKWEFNWTNSVRVTMMMMAGKRKGRKKKFPFPFAALDVCFRQVARRIQVLLLLRQFHDASQFKRFKYSFYRQTTRKKNFKSFPSKIRKYYSEFYTKKLLKNWKMKKKKTECSQSDRKNDRYVYKMHWIGINERIEMCIRHKNDMFSICTIPTSNW